MREKIRSSIWGMKVFRYLLVIPMEKLTRQFRVEKKRLELVT